MKKQPAILALLLSTFLVLSGLAQAQPTKPKEGVAVPIVVKFKLLQVSDAQAEQLRGKSSVGGEVPGKALHELEMLTRTDRESLILFGDKWPIIYFDPRAEQFQIQFVDVGVKLDLNCKLNSAGSFDVETRAETSSILEVRGAGELQAYPETNVFIPVTTFRGLKAGDTAIIGTMSGLTASRFLTTEGLPANPSNLIYTLRVERI